MIAILEEAANPFGLVLQRSARSNFSRRDGENISSKIVPPRAVAVIGTFSAKDVEQRIAAASRCLSVSTDFFERHLLARPRVADRLLHAVQDLDERRVEIDLAADHRRVREAADERLEFGPGSVRHRRPDTDVGLTGHAGEQHLKRGEQDAVSVTPRSRARLRSLADSGWEMCSASLLP